MSASPFTEAELPPHVAMALWRGHALGRHDAPVWSSGYADLDALLPGGGWPGQSLTEILQAPAMHAEWRLLSPALRICVAEGQVIMLINPPYEPHAVGLRQAGLAEQQWVCISPPAESDVVWSTEQVLKAGAATAVLAWLPPHVQPAALRRLQSCAARHAGPIFLFRPEATQAQPSAAPLRLTLSLDAQSQDVQVCVFKRRGPAQLHAMTLLKAWPSHVHPLVSKALQRQVSAPVPTPSTRHDHVALDRPAAIRQLARPGVVQL